MMAIKKWTRILKELLKRSIHYWILPYLFVATKIYSAGKDNNTCSINHFANWLTELFNESIRHRIDLLFNILDFDKDGIVHKEDILFFFNELFIVKYGKGHLKEFNSIMKRIKVKSNMHLDAFIDHLIMENSDFLYICFTCWFRSVIISKRNIFSFI